MKPIKRVAVIHDMCSVGKAAMTNILPVFSIMGIEPCPVPTMILSTHTGGFGKPVMMPLPSFVEEAAEHFSNNQITFDYIFIGYLGNVPAVREVQQFLKHFPKADVLFDPIMGDHGSFYMNFDDSYNQAMWALLPHSTLVTPNYTESCLITGEPCLESSDEKQIGRIAEKLMEKGCRSCVITSVPLPGYPQTIALCEGKNIQILSKTSTGRSYPGTGDLFASVLFGKLMQGTDLVNAAEEAHQFVCRCIQSGDRYGYPVKEGVLLEPNLKYLNP